MKRTTCVLIAVMSVLFVVFPASDSAAWNATNVWIDSPSSGELFETHDLIRVRWRAWIEWGYFDPTPDPQTIHYTVSLMDGLLGQGHYDSFDLIGDDGMMWGEVSGSLNYRVPGNGFSMNRNAPLTICTGPGDPNDDVCNTVYIRVKTWYDPLPIPQQKTGRIQSPDGFGGIYLDAPSPNPFNPNTRISFGLKEAANLSLKIFNVQGQLVKTLRDDSFMSAGDYQETWNGLDNAGNKVPSGVYFLKLGASNGYSDIRKLVLVE